MVETPKTDAAARIIDAATAVFLDKGYDQSTLQAVATTAGVAKGLVSHHFGSKGHLLAVVLEAYYDRQRAALAAAGNPDLEPREELKALLDAYFLFAWEHRRFPRMVQRVFESNPEAKALVSEQLGRMYGYVEAQLMRITSRAGPLSARQCYITFSGLVVNYFFYADILAPAWGEDAFSETMLEERRAHLMLVADVLFDAIVAAPHDPSA